MVMLEKLTLNNMNYFKEMYNKDFKEINYNKDFFRCYERQNFLIKFLYRKFIRLIKKNGYYIGYIWYERVEEKCIKIWALYIDINYIDLIDNLTLSYFNNNILLYEAIDTRENSMILTKIGFKKENYTMLLNMNITNYLNSDIILNEFNSEKNTLKSKFNIKEDVIFSLKKLNIGNDEKLRCDVQNDIFSQWNRKPLTVDDIYADMAQDYFLKDLSFFGKINNEYIGYGQIIFNRNMYTIVNFGIVSKYRGLGLSKILLNEIIDEARRYGIKELYIRVDSDNTKAINLYKWIGFKEINKILVWKRD
ncbi:GNAT family N-acetyltransferase [Clostridium nigeriense]|uniref:GNAT family N-acetyltransferase n=1 Tax=Clostridium nigeriense TaxID=1805470 RepID=UPI003D325087